MYNNYYSSTDVQIYFTSADFSNIVKIDTAMSVGYSLQQSSSPIYSLGSRKPQFYAHGNTLGQGSITIAFTDEEYLKMCLTSIDNSTQLSYYQSDVTTGENGAVVESKQTTSTPSDYISKKYKSNTKIKEQIKARDLSVRDRAISIGLIVPTFNISLYLNNETAIRNSDTKVINLIDVKIINETFDTSSTRDSPLMLTYNFMFSDVERG